MSTLEGRRRTFQIEGLPFRKGRIYDLVDVV